MDFLTSLAVIIISGIIVLSITTYQYKTDKISICQLNKKFNNLSDESKQDLIQIQQIQQQLLQLGDNLKEYDLKQIAPNFDNLNKQVGGLNKQLVDQKSQQDKNFQDSMQLINQVINSQIDEVKSSLNQSDSNYQQTLQQLNQLQSTVKTNVSDINQAKQLGTQIQQHANDIKNISTTMQQQQSKHNSDLAGLQVNLNSQQSDLQNLRALPNKLAQQSSDLASVQQNISPKLAQAQSDVQQLKQLPDQVSQTQNDVQSLKQLPNQLQSSQNDIQNIKQNYMTANQHQQDINNIQSKISGLIDLQNKMQTGTTTATVQSLAQKQLADEQDIQSLKQTQISTTQYNQNIQDIQNKIQTFADFQKSITQQVSANTNSLASYSNLQQTVQDLTTKYNQVNTSNQQLTQKIQTLQDLQNQMNTQLQGFNSNLTQSQSVQTLQQAVTDVQTQFKTLNIPQTLASLQAFQQTFQSLNPQSIQQMITTVQQLQSSSGQIPSMQQTITTLQQQLQQIQTTVNQISSSQQTQQNIQNKFLQVMSQGTDPNANGIQIKAPDDQTSSILSLKITPNTKQRGFITFDHDGVAGWSAGLDAQDWNKFKISPTWNDPSNGPVLTINNPASQKNTNVGINNPDPQAQLHVKGQFKVDGGDINTTGGVHAGGRIFNDSGNIDSAGDVNGYNIIAKNGLLSPWANINNGGGALLNVNSRGAGNPNSDGAKIWADPGKDATLMLQHTQDNKNSMGVTFDHQNVASWRVGMNQDNEFRVANSWNDTNANPAIKVQNGRDWMTLFANHVNICNPNGQNCRTIYG